MVVSEERLIYSVEKCVEILVERDGMTSEESIEYMDFKVLCAYIGKDQPIFLSEAYDESSYRKPTTKSNNRLHG